ncbi:MAG: hypothetical protein KDC95_02630 [Planctomycetes bacterium]|nr:hypothetical protein [Planctomycetota bacterium]
MFAVLALTAATAPLTAQRTFYVPASFAPENAELGYWSDVPMMRPNARLQAFYDATEVGTNSMIMTGIALRYDGPIPQVGAPGPFTIQRLRISVGTTNVSLPGAHFDSNLTRPLTVALDQKWSFLPDAGSQTPDVWGGPGGTLTFPFKAPVVVQMPQGSMLVVEFRIEGNDIGARTHALLDAAKTSGGPQDGTATSSGTGCSVNATSNAATIQTSGIHAPGAAHSIWGKGLGSNAVVVTMIGGSDKTGTFGALPTTLPGTACRFYTSWDFFFVQLADAAGNLAEYASGSLVPVPPDVNLNGVTLYEQLISVVPSANAHGLVTSDKRTVVLGTLSPPAKGIYAVSSSASADALVGDLVEPVGYAMRLDAK